MIRSRLVALVVGLEMGLRLTLGPCLAAGTDVSADVSTSDLYKRMLALNADLHTYKATVHVDVVLKSFPFLSPSLDGTSYYRQPDRQAVVFDSMPSLASQFKKIYPNVDPPSRWPALYDVTLANDSGGRATFRLVPKKSGRVARLDVVVDDSTATICAYTWTYTDGGSVAFEQTFKNVGDDYLIDTQSGHVDLPSYQADVKSNFSHYELNVALPNGVFDDK